MKIKLLLILPLAGLLSSGASSQTHPTTAPPPSANAIYITHVTAIDTASGREFQDRTVILSGGRILAVTDGKVGSRLAGSKVVDATGKYLIPGLWDMHVHMRGSIKGSTPNFARENEAMLPLYVANGVTGVREMGGDLVDQVLKWRAEVEAGQRLGPRIATAGPKLDGAKPMWPGSIAITTPEEARAAVQRVKAMGVDFVKVLDSRPNIPHDAYLALLDEAKRQNLRVTGHVSLTVTLEELSDAGQSIEHYYSYFPGCIRNEKQLTEDALASRISALNYNVALVDDYSPDVAKALFVRFAANGTWVTPTFAMEHAMAYEDQERGDQDPRRKYLMPRMLASWSDRASLPGASLSPQDAAARLANRKKRFQLGLDTVQLMHKEGVSLLAGTDTGATNPNMFAGFSLHDELVFLVEAGLSPFEALQCATFNAAKWLGRLDTQGTVEAGKLADLVLLDADPTKDIHDTTKISEVFLGGKEFDRLALDQMLRDAEAEAKSAAIAQ